MDGRLSDDAPDGSHAPESSPVDGTTAASTSATPTAQGSRPPRTPAELGLLYGLGAYILWGAMPLYFRLLAPAGPWEILAHRVLWSFLVCALLLRLQGRGLPTWRRPRREMLVIALASLLIAANWVTYLLAVTSGRVTEAALGYFLTPIVSVVLGLVVLRERLRPLQKVAVAIGTGGGLFLVVVAGHVPWIAFALATSFGLYGLVKKGMPADLGALGSLTAESALLTPLAVVGLAVLGATGHDTLSAGPAHVGLLVSTGIVTAVPLLLFALAAHRVTLVTIGLLQFISPVLQFITGLALGETMTTPRWLGFAVVWVALAFLVGDSIGARRRAGLAS